MSRDRKLYKTPYEFESLFPGILVWADNFVHYRVKEISEHDDTFTAELCTGRGLYRGYGEAPCFTFNENGYMSQPPGTLVIQVCYIYPLESDDLPFINMPALASGEEPSQLPTCDTCGVELDDGGYHYTLNESNRHQHACPKCWPIVRPILIKTYSEWLKVQF